MPRPRKRARSSPTKSTNDDDDDDDEQDNNSVDVVVLAPARSKRRTNSNPPKNNDVPAADSSSFRLRRGKNNDDDDDDDDDKNEMKRDVSKDEAQSGVVEKVEEEIFECPTCKKRFTSKYGQKYHIDNLVCQPKNRSIQKAKNKMPPASSSYESEAIRSGGRRKASLRATKKIMSLTKSLKTGLDSDEEEEEEEDGHDGNSDDDDGLVIDSDDYEEEDVANKKRRGRKKMSDGRLRRSSERQSYSSIDADDKFGTLEKGSRFITKFGVVEVIADDRMPKGSAKSSNVANPQSVRTFLNRQARFRERYDRVIKDMASGTRFRREEIAKMYAVSKDTNSVSAAGVPILSQEKTWNLYCKSLTLKQILVDGLGGTAERGREVEVFVDEDPRSPAYLHPNRIVECKLVNDERDHIVSWTSSNCEVQANKNEEVHDFEFHVRKRLTTPMPFIPMRLYLARIELTQEYDSSKPCYVCKTCCKTYCHREGVKYHLSNDLCSNLKDEENKNRLKRVEAIESKAISGTGCRDTLLTHLHGIVEESKRRGDPVFGNPHKVKEFKKHKWPPWLVFNEQRSSMYPEIYALLGFRRGSQNRNFFNKKKQEDGYVPKPEKTRLRKRLKKFRSQMLTTSLSQPHPTNKTTKTVKKKRENEGAVDNKGQAPLPPLLSSFPVLDSSSGLGHEELPPLPSIDNTVIDFGLNSFGLTDDNGFEDAPDLVHYNEVSTDWNHSTPAVAPDKTNRRQKKVTINKKKQYCVIDTQVLAAECDSGRYPTVNRYNGDHDTQCTICKEVDDVPLISCDYCKNSVHQLCLDKKMLGKDPPIIIRENEPDDTPMCHVCISTCLFRRWRAESRRSAKWQHELAKAGLGNVPEAANLREEINLKDGNLSDDDFDKSTYEPCPDGGPGGLICCSYCTAAYSRFLSNTTKEMEAQTVSRVGQEISEILELLADAKQRLQRASNVSQSNEYRRSLLDANQSSQT